MSRPVTRIALPRRSVTHAAIALNMASTAAEPLRQAESPFLALPLELVLDIISHLSGDRSTLCALARSCRLIHPFCEDHLYATIELLSTDDLQAICYALTRRPRRIEAVHTLRILYKYHKDLATTEDDRTAFNECVRGMKALKEWHIESPFDNFHWGTKGGTEWVDQDMKSFREALETASLRQGGPSLAGVGLAKLEKLIVHSHGAKCDFWELDRFHCLFRHPALRYLHVSCVSFPPDLPDLEPYATTTPLTTLIFDECELEPESLRRVLATPKALKHLTLGENVANVRHSRGPAPKLTSAPEGAMRALEPVAHSLETLTHLDPTHLTLADPDSPPPLKLRGSGMRDFHSLRQLTCDRCSFLHQGLILSPTVAPPNLTILRLRRYGRHLGHGDDWFDKLPGSSPYARLPSLKSLEFIQPIVVDYRHAATDHADYMCEAERLRERHAYAYKLWKAGVDVRIYAEALAKSSYIPPYLHGEPLPELLCLYDSVDVGFHRALQNDTDSPGDEEDIMMLSDYLRQEGALCHDEHVAPSATKKLEGPEDVRKEPVETNQLNNRDITRLRNEVYRCILDYARKLPRIPRRIHLFGDEFSLSSGESDDDLSDDGMALFLDEVDEEYDPEELLDMDLEDFDEAFEDAMDEAGLHEGNTDHLPHLSLQDLMDMHTAGALLNGGEDDDEDDESMDALFGNEEGDDNELD